MISPTTNRLLGEATVFWTEGISDLTQLSHEDIIMYLGRGTPRFSHSYYKDKRVLPPGHSLYTIEGKNEMRRVWTPLGGSNWKNTDEIEIAESVKSKLNEVVQGSINGARKVGLFLSGGLDSTILAYLLKATGVEVVGYVCKFPDAPETDETNFAKIAARHFKFPLNVVEIDKAMAVSLLEEIIQVTDRPLTCWSAISQLAVSRQAKLDNCDILFSGLGSDELFGGFSLMGKKYKAFQDYANKVGESHAWNALLGEPSDIRTELLFIGNATPFSPELLNELFIRDIPKTFAEEDVVEYYRELHANFPELDIAALMCSWEMEVRTAEMLMPDFGTAETLTGMKVIYPFFNAEMMECFINLPLNLRFKFKHEGILKHFPEIYGGIDKYILRLAFENDLPVEIQRRERMAYTAPFAWWLQDNQFRQEIEMKVVGHSIWTEVGVRGDVLKKLFAVFERPSLLNQWNRAFQIFQLYMIARWLDNEKYSR